MENQKIKHLTDLLQNIAAGVNHHQSHRVYALEVVLFEDDKEVLRTNLATILDYLANDIYWNEESDWRNANRAKVLGL
jgi:hypothetical protein